MLRHYIPECALPGWKKLMHEVSRVCSSHVRHFYCRRRCMPVYVFDVNNSLRRVLLAFYEVAYGNTWQEGGSNLLFPTRWFLHSGKSWRWNCAPHLHFIVAKCELHARKEVARRPINSQFALATLVGDALFACEGETFWWSESEKPLELPEDCQNLVHVFFQAIILTAYLHTFYCEVWTWDLRFPSNWRNYFRRDYSKVVKILIGVSLICKSNS